MVTLIRTLKRVNTSTPPTRSESAKAKIATVVQTQEDVAATHAHHDGQPKKAATIVTDVIKLNEKERALSDNTSNNKAPSIANTLTKSNAAEKTIQMQPDRKRKSSSESDEEPLPKKVAETTFKRCSREGCTNIAKKGGVCWKHGARLDLCRRQQCTNLSQKGGLCLMHGAKVRRCIVDDCTDLALKGGVCKRHGSNKPFEQCRVEKCINRVDEQGGLCVKHVCSREGCTNEVVSGELCKRHGDQQECSADGRTGRQPQQLGVVSPFSSPTMTHQQHTSHRHVSLSSPSNQTHFVFVDAGWVCRHCYPLDRYSEPNFARMDVSMSFLHPPPNHFVEAHLRICPAVNNQPWSSRRGAATALGSGLSSSSGGMKVEQFLHLQKQQYQGVIKTNVKGRAIAPSDIHNSSSTANSSHIRSLVANSGEKNSQTQSESDGKPKSSSSSGQEDSPSTGGAKRHRHRCSSDGCTNKVVQGGVCIKHGAKSRRQCSSEGCTKYAQTGGVCIRHGAKLKRCSIEGCTNQAQKGGVCIRHGAKAKRCSSEGCTNVAKKGGVCVRHGAKLKQCSAEGCAKQAKEGGVCIMHGATVKRCRKRCSSEGCSNQAIRGGVCVRHGAKVKVRQCSSEGCTNIPINGGVCRRHGAKVRRCSIEGCTNIVQRGGVCKRHGAYRTTPV